MRCLPAADIASPSSYGALSRCATGPTVVSDNGTEFGSRAILAFAEKRGINWHCIDPGRPARNAGIESFNERRRDEFLRRNRLRDIVHARELVEK